MMVVPLTKVTKLHLITRTNCCLGAQIAKAVCFTQQVRRAVKCSEG